eukprot:7149555-Prymnesium_polylepis.2
MQSSIRDFLCRGSEPEDTQCACKFVDLFCGCGGASCGAEEAGFDVVLAVDSWEDAVEVHKTNHPNAMHLCMELPPQTPLPLPADGENWHIHGSPPCTMVSKANQERDESGRQHAVTLIEWYIEFAMSSSATSWSMEQVATPIVLECIEKYRNKRTPNHKFAYTVLNFNNMGVPQNRKRLIAGSPDVVARLLRIDQWQRCAKDVLVHPRGTHIRNYMRNSSPKPDPEGKVKWVYKWYTDDEACVPITGPSHCVIAGQFLRWATPYSGKELMMFTTGEMAALQCFPK